MTVKELIELNQMICDVVIEVRKDGSLLLDKMSIGMKEGIRPPYPTRVPKKPEYAGSNQFNDEFYRDSDYIYKSINTWDDGKDYWQIRPERFPKGWLDLEVFSWSVRSASYLGVRRRDQSGHINVNFHGQCLSITALPNGYREHTEIKENLCKCEADGQISLKDFIEEWESKMSEPVERGASGE